MIHLTENEPHEDNIDRPKYLTYFGRHFDSNRDCPNNKYTESIVE